MQRRRKWTEVLSPQSLLLHAHCAPSRITTRTVIESVKDARGHGNVFEPAQVPDLKVTCFSSSAVRDRAAISCAINRRRTRRASRRLE